MVALFAFLASCSEHKVGFLNAETGEYTPDTMLVKSVLDPDDDFIRIENKAPWTTSVIQGVLGTQQLHYSIVDVKATNGGDAEIFRNELTIRGAGVMSIPFEFKSPKGEYIVTIKIENESYSHTLEDVYKFIIN